MEFRSEWFHRTEERGEFCRTIPEAAGVGDLSWQAAGKTKIGWSNLGPAKHPFRSRCVIEGRLDLDRGKIARIEFQPLGLRQIRRIESAAPFFETPGANADANLLLIG